MRFIVFNILKLNNVYFNIHNLNNFNSVYAKRQVTIEWAR